MRHRRGQQSRRFDFVTRMVVNVLTAFFSLRAGVQSGSSDQFNCRNQNRKMEVSQCPFPRNRAPQSPCTLPFSWFSYWHE